MILNTIEKSATAGKKATAGTSGVVDTSRKFATLINTSLKFDSGGKSLNYENICHQCN
jgi:hypothetical protein